MEMNALGGLVGAATAGAVLYAIRIPLPPAQAGARRTGIIAAIAIVIATGLWMSSITQIPVDASSLQLAGSQEKAAADKAICDAFGDRYTIHSVQVQPPQYGGPGQLIITFENAGFAWLSWPDATQLTVSLEESTVTTPNSFPVPGTTAPPKTAQDAQRIATRYAQTHFPWGLSSTPSQVYPVGEKAAFGWMTSWRRRDTNGVLMPMRLDIEVNTAGRVSQLLARHVDDISDLPPVRVDKNTASATAIAGKTQANAAGTPLTATAGELLAVQRSGQWRVQWLIGLGTSTAPVYVDATTGQVDTTLSPQQNLQDPGSATQPDPQATLSDGPPPEATETSTP